MEKKLKAWIKSLQSPKTRKATGCCVVEGLRTFTTFLNSVHILKALYITQKALHEHKQLLHVHHYTVITESTMQQISAATTPSGILAVFEINQTKALLGAGVVCARLQDPGNAGTLIRTCAALGKKTVVFVESVDPWSPKVIQSSAGTIAQMNIHELSWHALQKEKNNVPLFALVTQHGQQPTSAHAQGLFVVGNEANGIPTQWVKDCDQKITLAMPGNTESLNAAVAGSIALYITLLHK
ncbi:MAG: RNA methyltransferase [Candidatus Babeliaceae bacterium]|nr:RNA methyltransferase [Candidatus Babeliaceae bacterium]